MLHPARTVQTLRVHEFRADAQRSVRDAVTIEEPMEIRLAFPDPDSGRPLSESIAVTMRTPGEDFELATGFLVTEGVLRSPGQLHGITYCREGREPQEYNVVEVRLGSARGVELERLSRNVFTSSSCGVCGKASLDAVEIQGCAPVPGGTVALNAERVLSLPNRLREGQADFSRTGGIHAAGLFRADGSAERISEDVGRHNAVDKVVGAAFLEGEVPLSDRILVVSGRVSFEVVQKGVVAGIPFIVSVGAPSSLAVDLARRFNVTLAGFVRDGSFNVYHGPERVL